MTNNFSKWLYFILLCGIWGSSFVLMKLGLFDAQGNTVLTAWQVGAMRIGSAGVVLLPFCPGAYYRIQASDRRYVILSGILGSFIPAFLFCMAETKLDSALAGMLNALTPFFVVLVGALLFKSKIPYNQLLGILIGFGGCALLFLAKKQSGDSELLYGAYVLLATLFYGLNVNMVKQKLTHISAIDIAAIAFAALIVPSVLVLLASGFFKLPLASTPILKATGAALLLGILGTAFASVIFYKLVKQAGPVFSSLVTYGIPFVALGWGILYGESINALQVLALIVILAGVYVANSSGAAKMTLHVKHKLFGVKNKQ